MSIEMCKKDCRNRWKQSILPLVILSMISGFFWGVGPVSAKEKPVLEDGFNLNNEVFDLGVAFGTLAIEDFPTEWLMGISASFNASEDFFIQYNYFKTDIAESSFEKDSNNTLGLGEDRSITHYDILLGYHLFQSEFALLDGEMQLSTLYLVAGVGDTKLGEEENFSYTLGLGYEIEVLPNILLNFDYRQHIFDSALIATNTLRSKQLSQFSIACSYLF